MNPIQLFLIVGAIFGAAFLLSTSGKDGLSFGGDVGVVGLTSASERALADIKDPEQLRDAGFYGWHIKSPGMAIAKDGAALINDAVAGYERPGRGEYPRPARYSILTADSDCTPRDVRAGEILANISSGANLDTGDMIFSDLHMFGFDALVNAAGSWIGMSKRDGKPAPAEKMTLAARVPIVDVILTDTSGPLYVVLQSYFGKSILWNIVPAEGVEIAHITLVGNNVAINPPPGDYDIDYLPTGRSGCAPMVARAPQQYWDMYHRPMGSDLERYETRSIDNAAAYDAWFRATFGQGAEENVVGFFLQNHVMWGPMPEPLVPYRSVEGSTVLVTEQDYIFTAPAQMRDAFLISVQTDLITDAVGGDLALLFPEPLMRETEQ